MSSDYTLVIALIVFTFAVAIVIGIVQFRKARQAKQRHEHSSVGESPRHDTLRSVDGGERSGTTAQR
jgi:hypothetical protein